MDPLYIQNLRYKLQKRVSRLNSADSADLFHVVLIQFWKFLNNQPTYMGIIHELLVKFPEIQTTVNAIFNGRGLYGETEEEAAAIGYEIFNRLVKNGNGLAAAKLAFGYSINTGKVNEQIDFIRELFLDPLYEYIDEHLDDQRAMLALLRRYKHRSEWFYREKLWELSQEKKEGAKKRTEETCLAIDLYAFLYDQGIDFTIEPSSITGSVDLVAAQKTDDPVVLDAKIFDGGGRGKAYLRKAFNQIYIYTQQYNEAFGYLVIFKTTAQDLSISTKLNRYNMPIIVHNHKTIFLIIIDIFPHEKPISQRGELKSIMINEEEMVKITEESGE